MLERTLSKFCLRAIMKTFFLLSLLTFGTVHSQSYYVETENSFHFVPFSIGQLKNVTYFYAEWKYDTQLKEMVFNVSCWALRGWCALGISKKNSNMIDLDIILANSTTGNITVKYI